MTQLKIWKTHPSNQIPKKQTEGSACFDLQFQGHGKTEYKGFSRHNKAFTLFCSLFALKFFITSTIPDLASLNCDA